MLPTKRMTETSIWSEDNADIVKVSKEVAIKLINDLVTELSNTGISKSIFKMG